MTDQNAMNIVNELKKIAASLDIIARYIQKLETGYATIPTQQKKSL
jgi:hypothetical protein